jgi:hypothetical protein
MPARWSFEALAVEQYRSNRFERNFFGYDMEISQNEYYASYLIKALELDLWECRKFHGDARYAEIIPDNFKKLDTYIRQLSALAGFGAPPAALLESLNADRFTPGAADMAEKYLDSLGRKFQIIKKNNIELKDSAEISLVSALGKEGYQELRDNYTNKKLTEILTDEFNQKQTVETSDKIIQRYEPVFMKPVARNGRAHFYAPYKQVGSMKIDTFRFNIIVLWVAALLLYIALYYKIIQKAVGFRFPAYRFPGHEKKTSPVNV